MEIRIYDDKKDKWQSFEARLYGNDGFDGSGYELIGYGRDEAEAIANLKENVYQHVSDLEQKIYALTKIDFSKFVECNYSGAKIK